MIPTAMQVAASLTVRQDLVPAFLRLNEGLRGKAQEFDHIVKSGRTHLTDATPVRLGQELAGYAAQIEIAVERLYDVLECRSGNTIVGEYGTRDGIVDVVKLVVRMYVVAMEDRLAGSVDVYLMRGVGPVVQRTGWDVDDISRLREAQIDGVYYPPSAFQYDE